MDQFDRQEEQANTLSEGKDNINFGAVTTPTEMVAALKQFNKQIALARASGLLNEDEARETHLHITQVITQMHRPITNKVFLVEHLTKAATCVAAVGVLTIAFSGVIESLLKLIT